MQYFTYHKNCKSEFNSSFRGMQPYGPTDHFTLDIFWLYLLPHFSKSS